MRTMPLNGLRILIVEDDYYLATDATMAIEQAGGTVIGPFASADDALVALDANGVDLAIIDINLGTGPAFDLARHLDSAKLPFLFATGYDQAVVPDDLQMVVRLEKPFHSAEMIRAAVKVYEAAKGGGR